MHLCGACLLCSLQHAQSDSAKCRGWIRLAVNESGGWRGGGRGGGECISSCGDVCHY